MRRLCLVLMSILVICSCEKKWETSITLGVNSKRLDITTTQEGKFYLPVFSNTDWTISVTQGGQWLITAVANGRGFEDVLFSFSVNEDDNARVAKILLEASTNDRITVNVVQNGRIQSAKSISDAEL